MVRIVLALLHVRSDCRFVGSERIVGTAYGIEFCILTAEDTFEESDRTCNIVIFVGEKKVYRNF